LTFTIATLAGAIPWNFALAYAGLKLGQNYAVVAKYLGPIGIPLAVLVVILLAAAWWYGRKLGEEEDEKTAA
jgi:membrane protein DedA with SNARE-associated domain